MKGLIIDEPWIGLILLGNKTWEMRKTACHHRGRIALIRKGSGRIVGTADVIDSLPSLDTTEVYARAEPQHRIPASRQEQAFTDGWRTPWVLANARAVGSPVRYKHPSGAVIWVNLDPEVKMAVEAQGGFAVPSLKAWRPQTVTLPETTETPLRFRDETSERPKDNSTLPGTVRILSITGGNIRNNHIYLPLDFFPHNAIGGSNSSETASHTISVTFSPGEMVETDIDRTKRILRTRSPVGDFFKRAGVSEGDCLRLSKTGPYSFEISKEPND
jgi:ASCH domain